MTILGVFVPTLMAVGILVSGALIVADWVSGLLPSRSIRRRQQITQQALGVLTQIAETVDADVTPLPLGGRSPRSWRFYVGVAILFGGLGGLVAWVGDDLYEEPLGWLHANPWTLGIGYGLGGALLLLGIVSLIPAIVSLQSGRVVRALVEHTWLGKPTMPPDDPYELVGYERSDP